MKTPTVSRPVLVQDRHSFPKFKKHPLALAVASSLLVSASFSAQAAETQQAGPTEVVEVIGQQNVGRADSVKFTRPLLDTAQTVTVVPKNLIEERGATTLRDVLRNVSGISMQAGEGGTPAGDQLTIRGYSARTDIFVDNVRDFGGYTRDPFNLEQVEVVKGPSSEYSGRGSTGGSINLVSKAPSLESDINTNLAAGTDSFNRLTLDLNQPLSDTGDAAFRLNLMTQSQDVPGRDEVENKRWGIAPSIGLGLETDTQVNFSLFYMEQDNLPDYGIPWVPASETGPLSEYSDQAPPVEFSNWYGLSHRDFEDISTAMVTVDVNHQFSENVTLNNITRWGNTNRDSMITAPRFVNINTSTDIRRSDEKYRDQDDDIISNQTNLMWTVNGGQPGEQRILFGVEMTGEDEKRYTQAPTGPDSPATDLFNPNPNDPYLENYQRTGGASTADSTTVAVYASDSISINDSWQVNGSLRWDNFSLEYAPDGGALQDRTDKMLSYRAGVVYKPAANGSVYLGYGTSFNPSTEALSLTNTTTGSQAGVEKLDPEENRTLELGTKWEVLNRSLFLSAAIFRTEKTNARTENPLEPGDFVVLEGEQLVEGIELGVAGSPMERLNVYAGYTFLHTEVLESRGDIAEGNELSNSPKNSFNLWATYQLLDNLQFGLGAQYIDDRFSNNANTRVAPSYTIYEMSATYQINQSTNIRLNLQNVTDEEYIDYVGGGHFIPGMSQFAMLSANFNF